MQLSKPAKHRKNTCQQKPATGKSFVLCHSTVQKPQYLWLCLSSWDFFQIVNICITKEYKFVPQYFVDTCVLIIHQLIKASVEPSQANDKVRRAFHQLSGECEFTASSTGILECQVSFSI